MGTEDRRQENKIEPSSKVYEFIIFKGENIKSMNVVEEEPRNVLDDPAVLEVKEDFPRLPKHQPADLMGQEFGGWEDSRNYNDA